MYTKLQRKLIRAMHLRYILMTTKRLFSLFIDKMSLILLLL